MAELERRNSWRVVFKRDIRPRPRKLEVYGSRAPFDGARFPLSGRYPGWPARSHQKLDTTPALPLRGQHTLAGPLKAEAALCFPFNCACDARAAPEPGHYTRANIIHYLDMIYLYFPH